MPYPAPHGPVYAGGFAQRAAAPPGGDAIRIRIVTFNIEYALRVGRAVDALRTHERLRGADLLALQEMDVPGTRAIAEALHLDYAYVPASINPKYGRDVGNALLSPWPISDATKIPLPHRSRLLKQSRVALRATVTIAGRPVRAYSLHLGSPLGASPGQRRDQVDVVLRDAETSPYPVVIAGDFNSHGLGERLVARGYEWPTRSAGPSTRGYAFDHVFVRGLRLTEVRSRVASDVTDASDHRPVWVELVAAPF